MWKTLNSLWNVWVKFLCMIFTFFLYLRIFQIQFISCWFKKIKEFYACEEIMSILWARKLFNEKLVKNFIKVNNNFRWIEQKNCVIGEDFFYIWSLETTFYIKMWVFGALKNRSMIIIVLWGKLMHTSEWNRFFWVK